MATRKKGKLGIKTGAKALEKKLVSKANILAEDYSPLLPEGCDRYFIKEKRVLASIQRYSDDEKALSRLSRKGDKLGRAYAGLLLLRLSEKIPGIAVFRLPHGEASVSMIGSTTKDKLIGVQHYDDPVLRLYSMNDIAKKRKIYIYSTAEGMVCSGREQSPPKGFMFSVLKEEGVDVIKKEGQSLCIHLDRRWGPNLWLRFKSTDEGVRLCPRCLKNDRNSLMLVLRRISGRGLLDDIEAGVDLGITWDEDSQSGYSSVPKKYREGAMSDKAAYDQASAYAKNQCLSNNSFVAGERGFCSIEELVDVVEGSEEEKIALAAALDGYEGGIIASEDTACSVLSEVWGERGLDALLAVVKDKSLAERLYNERDLTDVGPAQIISEALYEEKKKNKVSGLPVYSGLGPVMSFADSVSRVYRMGGSKGVVHFIKNHRMEETRIKSLAYAFLLAVEEEAGAEWKYSSTEREFAEFLSEFALRLLECSDEEHREGMEALAQASGSGETLSLT